jgi:DhnA family fructose-bisphosphate aldolase class Ia
MTNKQYRLKEFYDPLKGLSLVVDTSNGLVLGALPGLEDFSAALSPLLPLVDGVVTGPGQSRNLGTRTRQDAALILRSDWTNGLRNADFVLPPDNIAYLPLLEPRDALDLGANALVMHFILGHTEQIEAQCLKWVVHLAIEGLSLGMPLIVDVQPIGPRVVLMDKAIELGVSYALEGGADGVAIPWPGAGSFKTIQKMCGGTPIWVKPNALGADASEQAEAVDLGAAGFWLDERLFARNDQVSALKNLRDLVRLQPVQANMEGVE